MNLLILTAVALPLGVLIGAIDTLFGKVLLAVSALRAAHVLLLVPFLFLAGLFMVLCNAHWGKSSSRGMSLIFAAAHGDEDTIPLRLVPLVIGSTWLTHLCGGSAGREGVAVQIGAAVSHWTGKKLHIESAPRILITAGMAAGFAGLFRTPIAAVAFALEVLTVGALRREALLPTLAASFTAAGTSRLLGLEKFEAAIDLFPALDLLLTAKLTAAALVFGLTGLLFSVLLKCSRAKVSSLFPDPYLRIAAVGALLSLLLLALHAGRYCGLGTNLISSSFSGDPIYAYDWIAKLVLTVLTLSAGYQGGEVTPLFSIGASLGAVLAPLFGLPVSLMAALGYCAVFGSATNTWLAPVFIGAEVFGYGGLPYFFLVCTIACCVNGGRSIYSGQKTHTV